MVHQKEIVKVDKAINTFSTEADSLKVKFNSSEEIQNKLSERLQLTKEMERRAFTYLENRDLEKAEKAFGQVDSIYPQYHQAYEIQRYLKQNRDSYDKKEKIPEIQNYTIENFRYGAPEDILSDIKSQLNSRVPQRQ